MTVTVVGVANGHGTTLPVPACAAGDGLIAHVVVWPAEWFTGEVFTTPPAGWTEGANIMPSQTRGEFGASANASWGAACYYKVATGSETSMTVTVQTPIPTDPTAGYVEGEPFGTVVAVRSDTGPITLSRFLAGWVINGVENRMRQQPPDAYGSGSGLIVYSFSGNATAITGYTGFVAGRVQRAQFVEHSDYPFSNPAQDPPSGPPWYYERFRDLLMTVESEPMNPASGGDRVVVTNFAYGLIPPQPWVDDIPSAGTVVWVTDPLAPTLAGWTGWIID